MTKPDSPSVAEDTRAARLRLREMLDGFEKTQLICVAARLGVADAMSGRGRLLVIELIMSARTEPPDDSVFMDLGMMVCFGARERSEREYRALFGWGGFTVQRIIPTSTRVCIMEAVPAARPD